MNVRDKSILRHIYRYCDEVDQAIDHFGDDRAMFMKNAIFLNAVSMPIQQIGELTKHLSDDFIEGHPEIPWKQIKGMRTWFAHQYMNMDRETIWNVMHEGIPPLKQFCYSTLNDTDSQSE